MTMRRDKMCCGQCATCDRDILILITIIRVTINIHSKIFSSPSHGASYYAQEFRKRIHMTRITVNKVQEKQGCTAHGALLLYVSTVEAEGKVRSGKGIVLNRLRQKA